MYYASYGEAMTVLIDRAEAIRQRLGMRQIEAAKILGVTQGHYSKVVNRRTPLAPDLSERLSAWVESNSSPEEAQVDTLTHRIAALADSIQRQCAELLQLTAARRPASSDSGVTS